MELKPQDARLLEYLYHHSREPNTKIAKALHLSREQVDYKIKKFLDFGIIKQFTTLFNYNALGYKEYRILLLKFTKPIYARNFYEKSGKDANRLDVGFIINKYGAFTELFFKTDGDFREYLFKILNEQRDRISDYFIFNPYYTKVWPLKFLKGKKEQGVPFMTETKEIHLDKQEIQILKMLAEDGRERIVDISHKLKISPELALYKIKKLHERKVVLSSAILFDMKKLGYFYSTILINIQNMSKENEEKIKNFAEKSELIRSIVLSMSKPNCFVQLFHKEHSDLINEINKLKELFKDDVVDIDVLFMDSEFKINPLPFL
ncbi:Lrp/AsnC family transcriptional regulator [Candidatus Pacearchaeota archaeon]|nr:Lrp/AsnC family transcriptional regulator [Candidatus Pacearchaeota archaeon]